MIVCSTHTIVVKVDMYEGEQRPFLREKRFFGARFLAREGVLQ